MDAHRFTLDGFHVREGRAWLAARGSLKVGGLRAAAKRHARLHGSAGVWFADGRLLVYTADDRGKVRQRTHRDARPA